MFCQSVLLHIFITPSKLFHYTHHPVKHRMSLINISRRSSPLSGHWYKITAPIHCFPVAAGCKHTGHTANYATSTIDGETCFHSYCLRVHGHVSILDNDDDYDSVCILRTSFDVGHE